MGEEDEEQEEGEEVEEEEEEEEAVVAEEVEEALATSLWDSPAPVSISGPSIPSAIEEQKARGPMLSLSYFPVFLGFSHFRESLVHD